MTSYTREQKSFSFQIKEYNDDTGVVKGYLATFDNVDEQSDRIRPGAFKRTLQSKYQYKQAHNKQFLFPLLWQHDTGSPIGGYTEAKEDALGLYVEFQMDIDVQQGKEAYSGLKKGYIFQQSIGYETLQAEYVKDADGTTVRDLTELRLWEGSIVTFPANELAVVTSVKAKSQEKRKAAMDEKTQKNTKTFEEHEQEEQAEDLLEDWQDVYLCALTDAVFDAIKIGDQPASDISAAIDAFKTAVLEKWVAMAVQYGLSEYISENGEWSSNYDLQYGSESKPNYGYMSRHRRVSRKAGRAISATNQSAIDDHVSSLHDIADKAMKDMKSSLKAVHTAADDFASTMQGAEHAYGTDPGNPGEGQQEGKSRVSDQEIGSALAALRTLRPAAV